MGNFFQQFIRSISTLAVTVFKSFRPDGYLRVVGAYTCMCTQYRWYKLLSRILLPIPKRYKDRFHRYCLPRLSSISLLCSWLYCLSKRFTAVSPIPYRWQSPASHLIGTKRRKYLIFLNRLLYQLAVWIPGMLIQGNFGRLKRRFTRGGYSQNQSSRNNGVRLPGNGFFGIGNFSFRAWFR